MTNLFSNKIKSQDLDHDKKLLSILSYTDPKKLNANHPKAVRITNLILDIIIENFIPFYFVECNSFKQLIKFLAEDYSIPDRTTFSKVKVNKRYEDAKKLVDDLINKANFISMTIDLWKSKAGDHFISLYAIIVNAE